MGGGVPKQYRTLGGTAILRRTAEEVRGMDEFPNLDLPIPDL